MLFGKYLVENGAVNEEQLNAALDFQRKTDLFLGELAIEQNLLTQEQVYDIYSYMATEGSSFSESTVNLGLLSQIQTDKLQEEQRRRHRHVGDILVMLKMMTRDKKDRFLLEYKRAAKVHASSAKARPPSS